MVVRWTPRAVEDLKEIARYIGADNPRAARIHVDKLKRRAESVGRFPKQGRVLPELARDDVRELIVGNYRIIYRVHAEAVDILTLFEGHKRFEGLDPHH
jgi:toxin ParE1/3/4